VTAIPAGNARVRGSRIVPFEDVSIGFAVDIGQGTDLAPCKVSAADTLTPAEIANQVWAGVKALRAGVHDGFNTTTRVASYVPGFLMRPMMLASSTVLGGWGLPLLGQQGNPLGSVFISNVAPLGVEEVFLAPLPFARTPVYISLGTVTDRPVVRDGVVQVVPQFTLCLTGDHRLVDGVQCAIYFDALKRYLADPASLGG
jgi:pyruvate dehydrogenase E2 component (dihydrolipoamide acetyltransferase)